MVLNLCWYFLSSFGLSICRSMSYPQIIANFFFGIGPLPFETLGDGKKSTQNLLVCPANLIPSSDLSLLSSGASLSVLLGSHSGTVNVMSSLLYFLLGTQ